MKSNNGTFQKLLPTDARGHGATAILACGFPTRDQKRLRTLLRSDPALTALPLVFVGDQDAHRTLGDLASLPDNHGEGRPSTLPRAMVLSGLTGIELHALMRSYRGDGMDTPLWASVTPLSATWTAQALLEELTRERVALREALARARSPQPPPTAPDA